SSLCVAPRPLPPLPPRRSSDLASGGGTIGVLLGGVLTDSLDWHWIFLVNLPIGVLVVLLSLRLLPAAPPAAGPRRLDVGGAEQRSEEHTSELQSPYDLVCRLLL